LHFLFRAVALLLFASFLDSLGVAQSIVSTYEVAYVEEGKRKHGASQI
jgi:hypothetical protein